MRKKRSISIQLVVAFIVVALINGIAGSALYIGLGASNRANLEIRTASQLLNTILDAEIDHLKFRNKVGTFQRDVSITSFAVEKDGHACSFGKWYYGPDRKAAEKRLPIISSNLVALEGPHLQLHADILDLEALLAAGPASRSNAMQLFGGKLTKDIYDTLGYLEKIQSILNGYIEKAGSRSDHTIGAISSATLITILAAFLLSIILGLLISRSLSRPIIRMTENLDRASSSLESASKQVSTSARNLSGDSSELASSVEEMTSSLEELQSIIESNTKNISEAEVLMRGTNEGAQHSSIKMEEMSQSLSDITENSKRIVRIIKVIDDIAFQTNILALNAAVEAARAGEAGRGFAVVAEQVKSLAAKSASAAKETAELIDRAIESVTKGGERGSEVKVVLLKVVDSAARVGVLLDETNRASREQLKGATQVTRAVNQINTVVQGTAANSEETSAAGEELLSQAEMLREVVGGLHEMVKGSQGKIQNTERIAVKPAIQVAQTLKSPVVPVKAPLHLPKDGGVEVVRPEDKIPLDDFKDF